MLTEKKTRIAVYAGTFDPCTNGHVDIIQRASTLFDTVVVALGDNPAKKRMFSLDERVAIIESALHGIDNVEVRSFSGLLVDFCHSIGANIIVRGLRSEQDFPLEYSLGLANKHLAGDIETVFLLSSTEYIFVSSSLLKEIFFNGGKIDDLVPSKAMELFQQKIQSSNL